MGQMNVSFVTILQLRISILRVSYFPVVEFDLRFHKEMRQQYLYVCTENMYHLRRLWQYWEKEVRVWNTLFLAGASQGVSLYILKVFHHKPKPHFWGSFSCIRMKLLLILSAFVAFSGAMSFTQSSPTDGMMWVRRSMGWNSTIEIFQTPFFLSLRKSWKVRRVENIDNCCRTCGKKG